MALPGVVKRHHPGRPGATTGAYVAALSLGAAAAAALVVPLAGALGGWRWAFALLAAPTALALSPWLRREPHLDEFAAPGPSRGRLDGADPERATPALAWKIALLLAVIFGLQSIGFSSMISGVATRYRDVGWSRSGAALATAIIPLLTVPAALIIPRLSDGSDRRKRILLSSVTMAVGTLGIALAPKTLPWLWLTAFGIGSGAIFRSCSRCRSTWPIARGRSTASAPGCSAWATCSRQAARCSSAPCGTPRADSSSRLRSSPRSASAPGCWRSRGRCALASGSRSRFRGSRLPLCSRLSLAVPRIISARSSYETGA